MANEVDVITAAWNAANTPEKRKELADAMARVDAILSLVHNCLECGREIGVGQPHCLCPECYLTIGIYMDEYRKANP
jgi:hypothetical protein